MTRLIFTCLVLFISLLVIQYTIWTRSGGEMAQENEKLETPVHKVHIPVVRHEYFLELDSTGKVTFLKRETIIDI